jgi:hypothetical protein
MQINNTLSRWQLVPLTFFQDGCAASQTNVQLYVSQVGGPVEITITGYTMPFAGEVIGISYDLQTAAGNGTLTIGPTIGGTECTDPTLSITTAVTGSDVCPRGKNTFAKNAIIGAEITTSGTWDGTDDLAVIVWVLLNIQSI